MQMLCLNYGGDVRLSVLCQNDESYDYEIFTVFSTKDY